MTIPNTLDEAVDLLLTFEGIDVALNYGSCDEFVALYHNSVGRDIRNGWNLWSGGELSKNLESLGLTHADDMSSVILATFYHKYHGTEYDLQKDIEKFKEHWKNF